MLGEDLGDVRCCFLFPALLVVSHCGVGYQRHDSKVPVLLGDRQTCPRPNNTFSAFPPSVSKEGNIFAFDSFTEYEHRIYETTYSTIPGESLSV